MRERQALKKRRRRTNEKTQLLADAFALSQERDRDHLQSPQGGQMMGSQRRSVGMNGDTDGARPGPARELPFRMGMHGLQPGKHQDQEDTTEQDAPFRPTRFELAIVHHSHIQPSAQPQARVNFPQKRLLRVRLF